MRRKSARNKVKNEEEEEVEKVARRSNRTRRRKKSDSSSPERDSESEEEVMPTPRTRRAVRPVSEERGVPSTPSGSRTRRSSRRIENVPEEVKSDKPSPDPEETVDRDSNGSNDAEADSSTVWKVQNSNGSGSGIAKLKLCRSGPVDEPEPAPAPRRGRGAKHQPRDAAEIQVGTVAEDDTSQTAGASPAQASPTPEPDSSGLAAKPGQVAREEEESKEESSSSEKSCSPSPEKVEQDSGPEEEDDDRKSVESKTYAKDKNTKPRKTQTPSPEKVEPESEEEEEEEDEEEEEYEKSIESKVSVKKIIVAEQDKKSAESKAPFEKEGVKLIESKVSKDEKDVEGKGEPVGSKAVIGGKGIVREEVKLIESKVPVQEKNVKVDAKSVEPQVHSDSVKTSKPDMSKEKEKKIQAAYDLEGTRKNSGVKDHEHKDNLEQNVSSKLSTVEIIRQNPSELKIKHGALQHVELKGKTVVSRQESDELSVPETIVQKVDLLSETQQDKQSLLEIHIKKTNKAELAKTDASAVDKKFSEEGQFKTDVEIQLKPSVEPVENKQKPSVEPVEVKQKPSVQPVEIKLKPSFEDLEIKQKPSVEAAGIKQKSSIEAVEIEQKPSIDAVEIKQKPSTEVVEIIHKSSTEAVEVKQKPSVEAVEVPQKPSVEAVEVQQKPSLKAVEIKEKPLTEAAVPGRVSEPDQEDEEQSDDEPLVELAPGSPDEPDPEMAEAEAVEAEEVEKALKTRKSRHRSRSSSSRSRSSSSESGDSRDRMKRQAVYSGSEDSEDARSPHKRPRVRSSTTLKQQSSSKNRSVESVTSEPIAPPTQLRRTQMSPKPQRERIVLRRTFSDRRVSTEEPGRKEEVSKDQAPDPEKIETEEDKENLTNHSPQEEEPSLSEQPVVRKRRWGSSKSIMKQTVLCISSDPLKNLIPDAKPVPANEVHLSPEEEEGEVLEDDEKALDHGKADERFLVDRPVPPPQIKPVPPPLSDSTRIVVNSAEDLQGKSTLRKHSIVNDSSKSGNLQHGTAFKHRPSCVLYITNLVRPFTVGQLKELLSRTGKIIEGGFWINSIKSQCYVEYDDEDQAIETRHALHGVRWPISNRKELHVEFAKREDMLKAQAQAEAELAVGKKAPQSSDGVICDVRDIDREERTVKITPAVREWDLGKVQDPMGVDIRDNRQEERRKREEDRRVRKEKRSATPALDVPSHKIKKKEEEPAAPVKLLDDLFRKTKTTPCIYWLPLTAEQIAEKEEMRRKHMAQHERLRAEMRKAQERNHGRERERDKERDRERNRDRERDRRERRRGSRDK